MAEPSWTWTERDGWAYQLEYALERDVPMVIELRVWGEPECVRTFGKDEMAIPNGSLWRSPPSAYFRTKNWRIMLGRRFTKRLISVKRVGTNG